MSPEILIERYELTRIIGRNGRVVFEALDIFVNRTVRIDIYQLNGLDFMTFREALMAAQQLQHPNIHKVLDAWIDADKGYIVFEWVGTYSLKNYMQKAARFDTLAARVDIIIQIGAAIEWIILRGGQPANLHPYAIMLDEHNTPFLESITWKPTGHDSDVVAGRPHYMAPELIMGQPRTVRTIQYSLGMMAYEILSGGNLPFSSRVSLLRGFMQQVSHDPTAIRSYAPDLPPRFDEVFARVLAREPEERYPSCYAFVDALREVLHAE